MADPESESRNSLGETFCSFCRLSYQVLGFLTLFCVPEKLSVSASNLVDPRPIFSHWLPARDSPAIFVSIYIN